MWEEERRGEEDCEKKRGEEDVTVLYIVLITQFSTGTVLLIINIMWAVYC